MSVLLSLAVLTRQQQQQTQCQEEGDSTEEGGQTPKSSL